MPSHTVEHERVLQIARPEQSTFKVVIVGRDPLTGGLLADALTHNLDCEAVAIRPSDLLKELSVGKVDLSIIGAEVSSSPGAGFELANTVSCAHPEIPIVLLLNEPSHDSVIRAFRSGASGVFDPQESIPEFIDCVEHVKRGFIWAGKDATASLLEAFKNIPAPSAITEGDLTTLTTRELQVVQFAVKGKSNRTIASDLRLSEHTVKNYLFRAFEKLGVSSRVELLFYLAIRGHSFGPSREDHEDSTTAAAG